MVDKLKAKELRELGKTYDEISKELGCSVAWCKLNLKGVTKHVMEDITVKSLITKAKGKAGITSGDVKREVNRIHPSDNTPENKEIKENSERRIKAKIRANDDTLIRPYWVVPEHARDIFYSMMRKLQAKDERDQEDIDDLRAEFGLDESYANSLKYALYSMSTMGSDLLGYSVVSEINRIERIVDELEKRNNSSESIKIQSKVKPNVKTPKRAYCADVPESFINSRAGVKIENPIDFSDIEELIY